MIGSSLSSLPSTCKPLTYAAISREVVVVRGDAALKDQLHRAQSETRLRPARIKLFGCASGGNNKVGMAFNHGIEPQLLHLQLNVQLQTAPNNGLPQLCMRKFLTKIRRCAVIAR